MVNGVPEKREMCEKSLNFLLKKGYKPWKILTWNQINIILTSGLSLRFYIAGYIQLVGGELNSQEVPLVSFSFCSLWK